MATTKKPQRMPYEIYKELDLGQGGYGFETSAEAKKGVQEAIRRKHGRAERPRTPESTMAKKPAE
jgi:hypothetical protein